jgi:hypothetical protein
LHKEIRYKILVEPFMY